ncbi:hypothetical protein HBH42_054950 [Parastagonospora nodorum]|nr:hypothetical protein HBH42_054950 [Parastagonospora nodorum]
MCIVPGISAHRYVALSYVWSRADSDNPQMQPFDEDLFVKNDRTAPLSLPQTLLLNDTTLVDLQNPGYLQREENKQRIPAVIKHAIELILALNERYLWVDRLCIVQNNLGDGGTLSQVAVMDKIYASAFLTIIAAASEDMYAMRSTMGWPMFSAQEAPALERGLGDAPPELRADFVQ